MKDYSNYHGVNSKDKIMHDGNILLDYHLQHSLEAYDVVIGDVSDRVIIQTTTNDSTGEKRSIICRPNVIDRGMIVQQVDKSWLVISLPISNGIYDKATLQLLNASISIETEPVVTQFDKFGNPLSSSEPVVQSFVCIADKSLVYGSADLDNAVNLPDNKIKVIIPYTTEQFNEFTLYDELYYVRDTDLTQVVDGKGLITITGERKVDWLCLNMSI